MKWAILIPTLPSRAELLRDLRERLTPQIEPYKSDVVAIVDRTSQKDNVADRRNYLLALAARWGAEYVSFIDDDDLVTEDYVSSILPLLDGVDTVQFHQAYYHDGIYKFTERRCLSWTTGNKSASLYRQMFRYIPDHFRDISHLSAIRRELVLPFRNATDTLSEHAEDSRWVDDMRAAGVLKTEHVVEKVLYHYLFRSKKEELAGVGT